MSTFTQEFDDVPLVDGYGHALDVYIRGGRAEFDGGEVESITLDHSPRWDATTARFVPGTGRSRFSADDNDPMKRAWWLILQASIRAQYGHEIDATLPRHAAPVAPIRISARVG